MRARAHLITRAQQQQQQQVIPQHKNYAHRASKKQTRFSKDLQTISETKSWEAIPALMNFPNKDIEECLRVCCRDSSAIEAVEYIVSNCLKVGLVDDDFRRECLVSGAIAASLKGEVLLVEKLFEHGLDANEIDSHGYSVLLASCSSECDKDTRAKLVELVVRKGADAENTRSRMNWTCLMSLAKRSDLNSMRVLLERCEDVDVNRKYSNGKTALFVACENGASIEVVKELISMGAKNVPAEKLCSDYSKFVPSTTPLEIAISNKHFDIAEFLKKYADADWFSNSSSDTKNSSSNRRSRKSTTKEVIRNLEMTRMNTDEQKATVGGDSW
jgi:hypothetical protein